jgi:hypothetical protein
MMRFRYPADPSIRDLRWTVLALALCVVVLGLAPALAGEEEVVDGVVHVRNTEARDGLRTVTLEEIWRAGGDEEDLIFGVVGQILTDAEGNIYVLDRQLSEVQVFSPDGEYLQTLSGEGEGPGEVRRPVDMAFLPDGTLGVVQMMPGKIVKVDLDGTPAGSVSPGGDPELGGFRVLFNVKSRNGQILACGEEMNPSPQGVMSQTRYLARLADDGKEVARYLEKSSERDMATFKWDEEKDYFVNFGRCALGPDGRVYMAPDRSKYEIHVLSPDGKIERIIERKHKPRKRNQEDKDRVNNSMRMIINGREVEKVISDHDPAITNLWVDDESRLWVLHSRSAREQPEGVLQTYDVFDAKGHFIFEAAVACPGDPLDDGLFLLGSDRAVRVKGMVGAAASAIAGRGGGTSSDESEEEAAPLEVICYRVAS